MGVHLPVVGVVVVIGPADGESEGKYLHVRSLGHLSAQVGGGVGENDEVGHKIDLLIV